MEGLRVSVSFSCTFLVAARLTDEDNRDVDIMLGESDASWMWSILRAREKLDRLTALMREECGPETNEMLDGNSPDEAEDEEDSDGGYGSLKIPTIQCRPLSMQQIM